MGDALPWFPVVGAVLGLMVWAAGYAMEGALPDWPYGIAALLITFGAVLTRGLHLDGVADWFDALGGGKDKDRMLFIMKDSHVGAFGVLALILLLLLKWGTVWYLIENQQLMFIAGIYIVSRTSMVELAVCLPYARSEGGTGGPFVNTAGGFHRYAAWIVSLLLLFVFHGLAGVMLFLAGGVLTWLLGFWFYRRINGITGDLLGTCSELVETGLLLFCVFGLSFLIRLPLTKFCLFN